MKLLSILLVSTLIIVAFGGSWSWNKKKSKSDYKSNDDKSGSWSKKKSTPAPTTPSPTVYVPTNDELCGCYQFDLVCAPIRINDEICYYYAIQSDSDEDYCDPISTLTLSTDNECGLTATDVDELLVDYAPKCYDIDPLNADGIQLTLDSKASSSDYGSSKSSYKSSKKDSKSSKKDSSSKSSTKSDGSSTDDSSTGQEDYIIFSVCFKAGDVAGFNQDGEITYGSLGGGSYTCDTPDLPNLCGTPAPTTPEPTTPAPVTPAPVTPFPTTPSPVDPTTTTTPGTTTPGTTTPGTTTPGTSTPGTTTPGTTTPGTTTPGTTTPITTTPGTTTPGTTTPGTTTPATTRPGTTTPGTTTAGTTGSPTAAPTFSVCNSTDAYNVAFLLDESGSVSRDEWDVIRSFVTRIIEDDISDDSYVALYEYASLVSFDRFLDFTGPKSTELSTMTSALVPARYSNTGMTETWDAVNRVLDDFADYTTNDIGAQQRDNILFLVTDGNPTDEAGDETKPAKFISNDYDTCPYIEDRLRAQFPNNYVDIVILVIDPDQNIDTTKIDCLDYADGGNDIISITRFDSVGFTDIEGKLREKICTDGDVLGEGAGPAIAEWQYCLDPDDATNCMIGLGPVPTAAGGGQGCSNDPGAANPCTTSP